MIRPAGVALVLLALSGLARGDEVAVGATQVSSFMDAALDQPVGGLLFRGGIAMTAPDDRFGGLSGVAVTGPSQQLAFVSDRGNFVSGRLSYDDAGRLLGLIGVVVEPLLNSKGAPLPRQYARDAESVDTIYRDGQPYAVRVSFEHLTRVADFTLTDARPGGAAREVALPEWLSDLRTNQSLESVCVAPPASPVAGSTLLITEDAPDADGHHRGWMLGQADKGPFSYTAHPGTYPTDCAFLPNGDLLVLERGVSVLGFSMALRRVPADQVRPGNLLAGAILLSADGGAIDNMESLAVHTAPSGETRILIGSDNNFNDWQRSLLLEFALPE
ncbi:esterase-like activity of phytase family protein [Devosia sp. FKR38]|uniref:esterase-like activity of phytase family protein n=1 Tax=Devosia sp. FKR38 TaxID=2562312 RepID=UPI0010C07FDF|nr:esterase-like activity of phytase family protein [Devosia sp. FKR38]